MVPTCAMPALLTRMSTRPFDPSASNRAPTASASATSQVSAEARAPSPVMSATVRAAEAASRSTATTAAPRRANTRAIAAPIPEPAPVITAVLPCRSNMRRRGEPITPPSLEVNAFQFTLTLKCGLVTGGRKGGGLMRRVIVLMLALAAVSSAALAQDFRGAITGRITDSSNARMPGVTVVATNVEGDYTVLYLNPGTYTVTAELSGFKKLARNNLQVRVGEKLGVDFTLEVGAMAETVQVSAEAPVLTTTSGSTGQTISEKTIAMMPLSDGNPFALARLAPGIAYNGDLKFSRPFDNAGTSGIVTGGAPGGNEFSLDGSPNMANGRRVAFVPPAGAVQEFKVETASFDAGSGHTAGATVNVTLKSGTNNLKGSAYTYYRSDKLAETDFFIKKNNAEKPELGYNRPGFTLGGPIVHDKTFFFAAVEW